MKKVFVLDLDDTLICQATKGTFDKIVSFKSFDNFEIVKIPILIRPWLDDFVDFCNKKEYNIAVWSAGQPNYVSSVVNAIFDFQPLFVFNWTHCYREGAKYYKRLSWCPTPIEKTYIIDDNPDIIYERDNYIQIKPFNGNKNDIELLKIIQRFK